MRPFFTCLAVLWLSCVLPAADTPEQQIAPDNFLSNAARAIDVSADGKSFLIRGDFRLLNLEKGDVIGQFAMLVGPGNRERFEIKFPGITQDVWVQDQIRWRQEEARVAAPQLAGLELLFQLRDLLRSDHRNARFKYFSKKVNGFRQPCLQVKQRDSYVLSLCEDGTSHAPSELTYNSYTYEFSDYRQTGSGFFPSSFQMSINGLNTATGIVEGVSNVPDPAAALQPPQGLPPASSLACDTSEEVSKIVDPEYPANARTARIQGMVVLHLDMDESGKLQSVKIISGHPMLAPAAAAAVSHWKFKPPTCNGQIVDLHRTISVDFRLH